MLVPCGDCGNKIEDTDSFCRGCGSDRRALVAAANTADEALNQRASTAETHDLGGPEPLNGAAAAPAKAEDGNRGSFAEEGSDPGGDGDEGAAGTLPPPPENQHGEPERPRWWVPLFSFAALALLLTGLVFWVVQVRQQQREVTLTMRVPKLLGCDFARDLAKGFLIDEGVRQSDITEDVSRCETAGELKVGGPVAREAAHVRLDVLLCDSSSTVFDDMLKGSCDLGISWRQVSAEENSKLKAGGFGDMLSRSNECKLAQDGIAVIVNGANPLNSISKEKLRAIFTHDVRRWEQLKETNGNLSGDIKIYAPSETVESFGLFCNALGLEQGIRRGEWVEFFDDSASVSEHVMLDPMGIGFVNGLNRKDAKQLWVLEGDESQPAEGAAMYVPFSYPLYLYRSVKADEYAERFRSFILSGRARPILKRSNLSPLAPEETPTPEPRLAQEYKEYKELTKNAVRLDVRCLFEKNKSVLKGDSLADVERWVSSIRRPGYTGYKTVLVLGFASNEGGKTENERLSEARARQVANLIGRYAAVETVRGFGSRIPLYGDKRDESDEGVKLNRRVEIWLRP